ncbi:YafY family transcriptional regulator [Brachybacterium endophyticum]|uniref:YafY family transcriptional regulator n=1 Tax=Brachybacterium endophyticum TaxID=2182385 RepID=A0A2U2RMP2_9MICO|nr:YafY family protein [Brachybacterium endophyticum]PWH07116.1 YafY family transcriptional regulator [Brachybacterium endophyticum]
MSDVTRRTLRLLNLLQSRTVWTGPELADELNVTTRSVRRDVDRLREMGYPVLASNGHGGGYQLGAGRALPPLLLEGEEATAVAVALRLAAGSGIDGLGEQAVRALAKLDGILPPSVRAEVSAVTEALHVVDTSPRGAGSRGTATAGHGILSSTLVTLARAVRDGVQVRLDYERADGERRHRRIEPYRVLSINGRWYLFAWDLDREDWRTFRLDRMHEVRASTFRFTPRPTPDIEAHVRESISVGPYPLGASVRILRPAAEVGPRIPAFAGTVTPDGDDACILRAGARDLSWIALQLAWLGLPVEVLDPPELNEEIARIGAWARGA